MLEILRQTLFARALALLLFKSPRQLTLACHGTRIMVQTCTRIQDKLHILRELTLYC
jgi:hypothetical protein